MRMFIQISSTYPVFPFSLISTSPGVVWQLVRAIAVGPALSRCVERIAVTNTFEMCTVPLPLSLLHQVKINKNWKKIRLFTMELPGDVDPWLVLITATTLLCLCVSGACQWGHCDLCSVIPLSSQVPSPCMQPCCPWQSADQRLL